MLMYLNLLIESSCGKPTLVGCGVRADVAGSSNVNSFPIFIASYLPPIRPHYVTPALMHHTLNHCLSVFCLRVDIK